MNNLLLFMIMTMTIVGCGGNDPAVTPPPTDFSGATVDEDTTILAPYPLVCDESPDITLAGCWRSTNCDPIAPDAASPRWALYIAEFHVDGSMNHYVYTYDNSSCIGVPVFRYQQPMEVDYAILDAFTSMEGLDSLYLALTWYVGSQSAIGYTGFHITGDGQLCFVANNFQWSGNAGGIAAPATQLEQVPTWFSMNQCLIRV